MQFRILIRVGGIRWYISKYPASDLVHDGYKGAYGGKRERKEK